MADYQLLTFSTLIHGWLPIIDRQYIDTWLTTNHWPTIQWYMAYNQSLRGITLVHGWLLIIDLQYIGTWLTTNHWPAVHWDLADYQSLTGSSLVHDWLPITDSTFVHGWLPIIDRQYINTRLVLLTSKKETQAASNYHTGVFKRKCQVPLRLHFLRAYSPVALPPNLCMDGIEHERGLLYSLSTNPCTPYYRKYKTSVISVINSYW